VELVLVELLCELDVKEVVYFAISQGDAILSSGGKIRVFLENSQHFGETRPTKIYFSTFKLNFFKKRKKLWCLRGFVSSSEIALVEQLVFAFIVSFRRGLTIFINIGVGFYSGGLKIQFALLQCKHITQLFWNLKLKTPVTNRHKSQDIPLNNITFIKETF
jgi:hypothetical protein